MADSNEKLPFEGGDPAETEQRRAPQLIALVHILTPEFQGLNPEDFLDIPAQQIENAAPDNLRRDLIWKRKNGSMRLTQGPVSYFDSETGSWYQVAVTPEEYGVIARSPVALGRAATNKTLAAHDIKLRESTGDETARARSNEDRRRAARSALYPVLQKHTAMQRHIDEQIDPRLDLIARFREMTIGSHVNLNRGPEGAVRERFEYLRNFVFDEMLDAIGNKKNWNEWQQQRAQRIIQKRLYLAEVRGGRVQNFRDMLGLAQDYFSTKRDLFSVRIAECDHLIKQNPDVMADIEAIAAERRATQEEK